VIGSALIPTMIANAFFMPSHRLKNRTLMGTVDAVADGAA
jgi:hypothetical protein